MNIKDIIVRNFWLKVISLILAVSLWLYVSGEVGTIK